MEHSDGDRQDALLDALATLEADEARLFARRVDLLVELDAAAAVTARKTGQEQFPVLELAGSCRLGQGGAGRQLTDALRWTGCLPATLALLRTGELLVHQARVLFETTRHCPEGVCNTVEQQVLAHLAATTAGIGGFCPADLRKQATRTVLTVEALEGPAVVADREAAAKASRRVWARPDLDGMGTAGALLPAEQLATWSRDLDTLARAEKTADRTAGIMRTADQRRADLFAALPAMALALRAGDPAGAAPGVSARPVSVLINVYVPMDTVLDLTAPLAGWPGTARSAPSTSGGSYPPRRCAGSPSTPPPAVPSPSTPGLSPQAPTEPGSPPRGPGPTGPAPPRRWLPDRPRRPVPRCSP